MNQIVHGDQLLDTPRRWRRVPLPPQVASQVEPGAEAYVCDVADGTLTVFVAKDPRDNAWHLSVSHPSRLPTWDEILAVRTRFVPDAVTLAMILPPRSAYVNLHPRCFHLWQIDGRPYGGSR